MPIVFNGTTITENEANAFSFNGVDITEVIFNGTVVWTQNLFNATWSGQALANTDFGNHGIETSGSLFRARWNSSVGAWLTANADGTFSGGSSSTYNFSITSYGTNRLYIGGNASGADVYFNIGTGFTATLPSVSGTRTNALHSSGYEYLFVSSGLLGWSYYNTAVPASQWISLT